MTPVRAALPVALLLAAPAGAADYSAFRDCVGRAAAAPVTGSYGACAAPLVAHCAAAATASEAATCIDAQRAGLEAAIGIQVERLTAAEGAAPADIDAALAANRATGEASCAVVAARDAELAVGQRAVNAAFCRLVVSADVLGMAYRLEDAE